MIDWHAGDLTLLAPSVVGLLAGGGLYLFAKRLRARTRAPILVARGDWQPIETAPKDGSTFITYSPAQGGGWCRGFDFAGFEDGWFWKGGGGWIAITHWMPLPPPPAIATEAQRAEALGSVHDGAAIAQRKPA